MANDIFGRLKDALADRYRLDRLLGQGGMATVYLAEDLKHHRQVAIKVLRADLSAALGAERFLREIELAAKLQHPHIVPVYDSGNADGILYYVMPFVEGESLRDLLKRQPQIPLARAAEIVRAAASGLAYAHAQGIVHRDVKPENIMLSGDLAVVTDFGIARAVDASRNADANLTGVGMAMGTPAYMSPEQATADTVDARTDQYALACVFYEMVSGKQAFSGPTMAAMLTSILTGPRPRLTIPGITAEIDGATQRALSTDPSKRFADIRAFADAVASESSGVAAASRESRRWKRLAFGLPLAVAAMAAIYVGFFAGPPRTVVSGAETIAVVPFSTSGAGLEGMGEGMVDLLAVNLNGVGAIRTIEARAVLNAWRRRVKDASGTLDDALDVARDSKAASVLTGSIIASGGTARITADLYDLQGKTLAHAQVSGPTESVLVLADSLAVGLLHEIWRSRNPIPSANGANITSRSMPAIRAYLRGESFHRHGAWDSAAVAFQEAIATDSTFALAWYRLTNTMGWMGQYQSTQAKLAAANAVKFLGNGNVRLRSLMVLNNLFAQGDVAAIDSALAFTKSYPNDLDGWFLLGESQYHMVGYRPRDVTALREPFDKVLAIDSTLTPAAIHPMELALQSADTALLRHYEKIFAVGGDSSSLHRLQAARSFLMGSDSGLTLLAESGALGQGATRGALFGRAARASADGDSLAALAQSLASAPVPEQLRYNFKMAGALLLAGAGRMKEALAALPPDLPKDSDPVRTIMSFPVMMAFASDSMIAAADADMSTISAMLEKAGRTSPYFYSMSGIVAYDRRDFARASSLARRTLTFDTTKVPVPRWLRGTALALDGLALVGTGDTLRGMLRADSGLRLMGGTNAVPFTPAIQIRYATIQMARPASRAYGIERLRNAMPNSPELAPINALRIARGYEAAEKWDSAAVNYQRFLKYFNAPMSELAFLVKDAQAGLDRAVAERGASAPVGAPKS